MDKTLTLGILLMAKDAFSPVFSSFKSSLGNMTKSTQAFGTVMAGIGTGLKGASLASQGATDTIIKSFVDLEDAQIQLENTLMKSDGSVSPFFKSINDEATKLGNTLPGTTADFYKMASTLKSLGVEEKSIVGGALKSAAYLGVVLKIPYEEAATATAKFKQALGIADDELLPFINDIQRMSHMGVQVGEMSFAFSKVGATMKGLGLTGLKAAKDIEPLVGLLIQNGISGETAGTGLGNIIKDAVSYKGNKNLDAMGIKLNFTDAGGNFKGTGNMIKELEKLKAIKSDAARISAIESIFGKGEASGMVSVLIEKGTKGVKEFSHQMDIQADINQRAANAGKGLGNMWESLTGTFTGFTAIIGKSLSPQLKGMTEWFNGATSALSSFAKEHPNLTKFVGVAIVGFTAVTGVLGTLGIAVGAISMALGALGITSMVAFGWIIGGVALVAGAAYLIISSWRPLNAWFSNLWSGVKSSFSTTWTVIKNLFSWTPIGMVISNWGAISPYFNGLWSGIKAVFSVGFDVIKAIFAWTPLGIIINNWGAIASTFGTVVEVIKKPFVEFFGWIENKFMWVIDKISTVGSFFANNNSSMLTAGTAPTPARVAVSNPRVAAARAIPSRAGTNNNVTVNISNPNFTSKEHAAATQKQLDEQVRKAMARHANDKKDRSYS